MAVTVPPPCGSRQIKTPVLSNIPMTDENPPTAGAKLDGAAGGVVGSATLTADLGD